MRYRIHAYRAPDGTVREWLSGWQDAEQTWYEMGHECTHVVETSDGAWLVVDEQRTNAMHDAGPITQMFPLHTFHSKDAALAALALL